MPLVVAGPAGGTPVAVAGPVPTGRRPVRPLAGTDVGAVSSRAPPRR
ncbi:hypothetical protein ACIBJE_02970 [Micromonospora sp. NPDC050187]